MVFSINAAVMFVDAGVTYKSQAVISLFIRRIIVPPYCGVPKLSHQFPVAAVVVVVVVILAAVVVEVVV